MTRPEPHRWGTTALGLACALLLIPSLLLFGCGSDDPPELTTPPAAEAPTSDAAPHAELPPGIRVAVGSPSAKRRVVEDCDPAQETLRYTELIGSRALATLRWTDASPDSEDLKIPLHVTSIAEGGVAVRFLAFPMREQYLHVWIGSDHISALGDNIFLLDPCSASLEPWPET